MPAITQLLGHLVDHVPGLSPDNRAEAAAAVEEFGRKLVDHGLYEPDPEPEPTPEEAAAAAAAGEKDAEIARLKAELAARDAAEPAPPE